MIVEFVGRTSLLLKSSQKEEQFLLRNMIEKIKAGTHYLDIVHYTENGDGINEAEMSLKEYTQST